MKMTKDKKLGKLDAFDIEPSNFVAKGETQQHNYVTQCELSSTTMTCQLTQVITTKLSVVIMTHTHTFTMIT